MKRFCEKIGLDWEDVKEWIEDIVGRNLRSEYELVNNSGTHKRAGLQKIFGFDFGELGTVTFHRI